MKDIEFEILRNAIVKQAVDDYCAAVRRLVEMNDKDFAIKKIITDGKKGKFPKVSSMAEAEEERLVRIKIQEDNLLEVERFFHTEWYKNLCAIGSKYMINVTKEKAIMDMVNECISGLQAVKAKNLNGKKAQKTLKKFERLKLFLCSDWLKRFTKRDAEAILQYMKAESGCPYCDFTVQK